MEIKSLGYRTDLFLLGLGGSEIRDAGPYVVIRTPKNPTFWWGNYLLHRTPLAPGDLVRRAAEFRTEFPDARHLTLGIDTTDGVLTAEGAEAVEQEVKAAGGRVDPSVVMTASTVNAPQRPNTTSTYRFLSTDDDWQQVVDINLATSTMAVDDSHREFTRLKVAHDRELVEAGHGRWFGAFDGDRLQASLGLMFDGKGLARFQTVQTHPDDRNQGIASTLVHQASTYGFENGATTLVMVADPEYLAIRIYRALGFTDSETQLAITIPPAS
ncbi:GNAT family N-acetyltransferase [Kribbella antibiotica]|uniref:GNAT family N-acetyltransferase n=1 Tax=Kribbella antibiotica TaxID=190195 RepID=A0A4R4ZS88_9ACTN|nr:GNAT family N-acetyltransferase [Kribbella antibiotica]TDD61928.1 GNAT family N-acetyltransferase [Kribbella antibiotica]